jgi:predicted MFS family arabinose efflux permease
MAAFQTSNEQCPAQEAEGAATSEPPAHDTPATGFRGGAVGVLSSPGVKRALLGALIGRLPSGMAPLALLLAARSHGFPIAQAGGLVGLYAVGVAIGSPLSARAVDRSRQSVVLYAVLGVSSAGLVLAALGGDYYPLVAIGALIGGLGFPPLEACLRALWPSLLHSEMVAAGYSLDVASQEIIFVVGPVLTIGAVTAGGGSAGLLAAAALQVVGTLIFATSEPSRLWRGEKAVRHWLGPLRERRVLLILASVACIGAAVGANVVAVTAYAESSGTASWAGWLLAMQALGALAGGMLFSYRGGRGGRLSLPVLALGMALGYLPLFTLARPAVMLALIPLSGLALPPLLTLVFLLIDELAPAGTVIEAFAWIATAFTVGSALGSPLAGASIGSGISGPAS